MQARPDKIGAFNREVWANCPAAPAAVSAARALHCKSCGNPRHMGRGALHQNRCCKPEDLPHAPLFCVSEGTRKSRQIISEGPAPVRRFLPRAVRFGIIVLRFFLGIRRGRLFFIARKTCAPCNTKYIVCKVYLYINCLFWHILHSYLYICSLIASDYLKGELK